MPPSEDLLDDNRPSGEEQVVEVKLSTTRRGLLAMGVGTAATVVLADPASAEGHDASTSPSGTTTVWRLDADWGYPIGTSTGGSRSRCKGRACHSAAPNRFFVSREQAEAGRLHKCCLAQAVPVTIAVGPGTIQPYFTTGHIDLRTADLPDHVRAQLAHVSTHRSGAGDVGDQNPTESTTRGDGAPKGSPSVLAHTGSSTIAATAIGTGAVLAGSILSRRNRLADHQPS